MKYFYPVIALHEYRQAYLVGVWEKKSSAQKEALAEEQKHPGYRCQILKVPANERCNMHNLANPDHNFKIIKSPPIKFVDFRHPDFKMRY